MVDSLRAALRLLPAVRPRITGLSPLTYTACARVSASRLHTASEQSGVLVSKYHPQVITSEKTQTAAAVPSALGLVRIARAVLAYVGAGLSAVTANQFSGPSILQAKELGLGGSQTLSSEEARGMWQRATGSRQIAGEEALRSPKFHSPLPHVVSKVQADACHPLGQSYYWNNTWGSADVRFATEPKMDSQWQYGSSTNRAEIRPRHTAPDEGMNCRFSKPTGLQALTAESQCSLKCSPGFSGTVSDFCNPSDLQLEWQLIVDPKATREVPICSGKMPVDQTAFEEAVGNKDAELAKTSKIMTKQVDKDLQTNYVDVEIPSNSFLEDGTTKQRIRIPKEMVLQSIGDHQEVGSLTSSLSWKTAQENVDSVESQSPTSQRLRVSYSNTSLSKLDFQATEKKHGDYMESLEGNLLSEILHGSEPTAFSSSGLLTSAFPCGPSEPVTTEPPQFHKVFDALPVPLVKPRPSARRLNAESKGENGSACEWQSSGGRTGGRVPEFSFPLCSVCSADSRNTSWDGVSRSSSADRGGHGLLGEALCRSQTRAREAEKKVQQASEERERLVRLILREASRSLTYRQCADSLQIENVWLKKCASNESLDWLHRSLLRSFSTVENLYSSHWKALGQHYALRQIRHDILNLHRKDGVDMRVSDPKNIMMGCTLGLAFALGLSFAGAGLVLGWSMGWILVAYSVSV